MRVEQLDALAASAREGLDLRLLHGVEQRVEQVQRHHHEHAGQRVDAFELPGDAGGMARNLLRARLRIDAIGFDETLEADVANGVRVGVSVGQVRALAGFGIGEDDLGADFEAGANGFGERICRLDEHVSRLVILRIEDQRHLRQALDGADPSLLQADRKFQGDHLGALAEDSLAHFDGEFQAAGRDGEIGEAAAPQAAGFRNRQAVVGHSAALPLRGRG